MPDRLINVTYEINASSGNKCRRVHRGTILFQVLGELKSLFTWARSKAGTYLPPATFLAINKSEPEHHKQQAFSQFPSSPPNQTLFALHQTKRRFEQRVARKFDTIAQGHKPAEQAPGRARFQDRVQASSFAQNNGVRNAGPRDCDEC